MFEPSQEPYKPHDNVRIADVPSDIESPKTDGEIVETAQFIIHQTSKSLNLLPEKYAPLEKWLKQVYDHNYHVASWVDVAPRNLDYLYQQYAIKMDKRRNKNGFNTFGLYALSYLDGLRTMDFRQGYLGTGGWESRVKDKYRGLLLGCSSISSASDFFTFINSINPSADAVITDIDPLAVKLATTAKHDRATQTVIQSDAQRIPLLDGSVDFVATNFLVPDLIDVEGSGKDTIVQVMKETKRILSPEGRLVMIEQLGRSDLEWLSEYAYRQDLVLATGGPEGGILRPATIFPNHRKAGFALANLGSFIGDCKDDASRRDESVFTTDPIKHFGGQKQRNCNTLIFRHSSHPLFSKRSS